jgi:hypothetical protein
MSRPEPVAERIPVGTSAAAEVLRSVTANGPAFDPGAAAEKREEAIRAWEAWWMARRDRLRPDRATGRFVKSGE